MKTRPRAPGPPGPHPAHGPSSAFSLIELIGVLAILTIFGLALVPPAFQAHDRVARERESRALENLAEGLRRHALRQHTIPAPTDFPPLLATELGWQVSDVVTNARHQPRVFLLDPAVTNTLAIPFVQGPLGVTGSITASLRLLLFSSVGEPLPTNFVSGLAASTPAFSNIWNVSEGSVPAGWSWAGRGDDLRIQRVNLDSYFVPLILNYDTYTVGLTNQGRFTVGASATNTLPTTPSYVASFLRGSVLGLHHHAGTSGTLQAAEVLQHPLSFVYERDAWRGQLFLGRGLRATTGLDLQAAHDLFMASPTNAYALGTPPATPTDVVIAMSNYMAQFVLWRDAGYPASHPDLDTAQTDLQNLVDSLINTP